MEAENGKHRFTFYFGNDRDRHGWVSVMDEYEITVAIVIVWGMIQLWIGIEMILLWDKVKDNDNLK